MSRITLESVMGRRAFGAELRDRLLTAGAVGSLVYFLAACETDNSPLKVTIDQLTTSPKEYANQSIALSSIFAATETSNTFMSTGLYTDPITQNVETTQVQNRTTTLKATTNPNGAGTSVTLVETDNGNPSAMPGSIVTAPASQVDTTVGLEVQYNVTGTWTARDTAESNPTDPSNYYLSIETASKLQ